MNHPPGHTRPKPLAADQVERAETTPHHSDALYRATFDQAMVGIAHLSPDGRWLRANQRLCEIMGYTEDELLKLNFAEITHPDDRDENIAAAAQVVSGETQSCMVRKRYLRKDGGIVWVNVTSRLVRNDDGSPDYLLSVIEDVTDLQLAQEALAQSEARYRQVVEDQTDLICRYRPDLTLTFVNRAFCEAHGKSANQLIGVNLLDLIPPEGRETAAEYFAALSASRPVVNHEAPFPDASGKLRWMHWTDRVVTDETGQMIEIQGVGRDVTERKLAEEAEQEQHRFAEALRDSLAVLTTSSDVDQVLRQILESAAQVVPCDAGSITLFEEDGGRVAYLRGFTPEAEAFFKDFRFSIQSSKYRNIRAEYKPYVIADTRSAPEWVPLAATDWIRSSTGVPIELRGIVIGLLTADSAEPNRFTQRDADKLQAFARYASLALENADHVTELERKVVERTAQLNGEKLRVEAILNNSLDSILLVTFNLRIQQTNSAFNTLFGYAPQDYVNHSLLDFVQADEAERVRGIIAKVIAQRTSGQSEVRFKTKDGTGFEAELGIGVINDNEIGGLVCTIRDITERKRAEREADLKAEQEHKFQQSLTALHEVTLELAQIDQLDDFYRRTVELGRERLGFERLALFLHDKERSTAIGTYGTDMQGSLTDERQVVITPSPTGIMLRAFQHSERFCYEEATSLHTAGNAEGFGWNAAAVLWNGAQSLGWLVADNGITHAPSSKALLDLLALYSLSIGALLGRKQVEADLSRSQASLQIVMNSTSVGIILVDRSGVILLANQLAQDYSGWLYGQPLELGTTRLLDLNLFNPAAVREILHDALEGKRSNFELPHKSNGNSRVLDLRYDPVITDDGSVIGAAISLIDITERKRDEAALRESEARYRMLAENISDLVMRVDPKNIISYVSPSCRVMLGYEPEEMLGRSGVEYVHPDDLAIPLTRQMVALEPNADPSPLIYRMRCKDGHYIWVETRGQIVFSPETGELTGFISVSRDVTERVRAQEALRRSEALLRKVLENLPVGVWLVDAAGTLISGNPAVEQIWGEARYVGMDRYHEYKAWWLSSGERVKTEEWAVVRALTGGETVLNDELEIEGFDGAHRYILNSAIPIWDDQQQIQGAIVVNQDITMHKRAENTLREAVEKEKEVSDLKSRFVSIASHEFRTPLATILSSSEMLLNYRHRMEEDRIDRKLQIIAEQVKYLTAIIEDVLDLTRLESGKTPYTPSNADLDSLCRTILDEFRSQPKLAHEIHYTCDRKPLIMMLDKRLMRQVIINLISNALKYSPEGTTVYLDVAATDKSVTVQVRDQGIGIPPADQKYLFEPFHRAGNVGSISGTGLGLSITKQAVDLHGGIISVESEVGVGTTFTVTLPLR